MENRRFVIVNVAKSAQKNDTGKKKSTSYNKNSVYTGTPAGAAKKAFTNLCRSKSIKGRCTLNITVQEVGKGKQALMHKNGNPKVHSYSLKREKLKVPIELQAQGKSWLLKYRTVSRTTPNVCTLNSKIRRCKRT
jgi:hypothetical protein